MPSPFQPSIGVPVIETERLQLRIHRLDDLAHCAAMWADAEVTRFIGGRPLTEEETWARLLRYAGHWALLGFGYWLVEEKITSNFVGEVGFADHKRDIEPSLKEMPEIGWVIATPAHGRGYATEAVRAALKWGDAHFPLDRTCCIIDPENIPSIRVAEKCGYQESQLASYKGKPTKLFVREPNASE
jgi:RimJ/RimL family protein N-acetyltransferase